MWKLAWILVLFGQLKLIVGCPSGCAYLVNILKCDKIDKDTIFSRSVIITTATILESVVDVEKLLEAYPNIDKVNLINSQTINCPSTTAVTITGGCSSLDEELIDDMKELFDQSDTHCESNVTKWVPTSILTFTYIILAFVALKKVIRSLKRKNWLCCKNSSGNSTGYDNSRSNDGGIELHPNNPRNTNQPKHNEDIDEPESNYPEHTAIKRRISESGVRPKSVHRNSPSRREQCHLPAPLIPQPLTEDQNSRGKFIEGGDSGRYREASPDPFYLVDDEIMFKNILPRRDSMTLLEC